ncbi:fasciclin domain-containing protein [Shimia sp. CNT1-13L.2]|uniref:fasciclin domain-containing protein n=1 Tax=Shimia sp. CNT1-13L.2 TaxID=2959663 RepID=UPI0020CD403D|nr:fasciclin domain-containing protein [Shimia sp. CNT1-13L.2]MCP9483738.1 fasciclin domain-containing protein [Shimia sp. CNT1-13L.2]
MASITGTVIALSDASGYDSNGNDFDILRDLLITADSISDPLFLNIGLVAALDTVPNLTVFAPEDNAFTGLATTIASVTGNAAPLNEGATVGFLADVLTLLGKGDASGILTDILTYHVAPGVFTLNDVIGLGDNAAIATLLGENLTTDFDTTPASLIDLDNGLANPGIIGTDNLADNGIIHIIDGVLLPAAVSSILTAPHTDFEIGTGSNERFFTGRGNDFVDGNGGRDFIRAGSGDDVAIGGAGRDVLSGQRGNDVLIGEEGRDRIFGGRGEDTIDGGTGNDILVGGYGDDTFRFKAGDGNDYILDFRPGHDVIDLSGYDGIDSFDDIAHDIHKGFFRTTIDLDGSDSITLVGFWARGIDADDFLF